MQYQGGLEQLVLYSIEEDLKRDAVIFAPCCTDDYDGAIDAILRATFRLYRPWENFNINQNGAKSFFTSNALIRDGISLDADAGEQRRLSANCDFFVTFGHCIKGHKAFLLKFQ